MRNLVVTASVSRNAGGLFESVRRLSQSLHTLQGMQVDVLALEDEHTGADIPAWYPLNPRTFPVRGLRQFGYSPGFMRVLRETKPDIAHTHGLWMYPSMAVLRWARKTGCPRVVSPHGMLDPWAVRNSAWKKKLASVFYEGSHLKEAACIRALCESEARSIRHYGLKNPICVIPNGIDLPEAGPRPIPPWDGRIPSGSKILLFLGRIHPKKGLMNLLKAFAAIKADGPRAIEEWHAVIVGWDQGGHETELKNIAGDLGIDNVLFLGPLFDQAKRAAYACADAFTLPSFSEGLPMVVLEAWAHRLPVVITPECNLPEGFLACAAVRIDPSVNGIAGGLRRLFSMSERDRRLMGENGFTLVERQFTWSRVSAEMRAVYEWILGGGVAPACVLNGSRPF